MVSAFRPETASLGRSFERTTSQGSSVSLRPRSIYAGITSTHTAHRSRSVAASSLNARPTHDAHVVFLQRAVTPKERTMGDRRWCERSYGQVSLLMMIHLPPLSSVVVVRKYRCASVAFSQEVSILPSSFRLIQNGRNLKPLSWRCTPLSFTLSYGS